MQPLALLLVEGFALDPQLPPHSCLLPAHCLQYYESFADGPYLYIVMELVEVRASMPLSQMAVLTCFPRSSCNSGRIVALPPEPPWEQGSEGMASGTPLSADMQHVSCPVHVQVYRTLLQQQKPASH